MRGTTGHADDDYSVNDPTAIAYCFVGKVRGVAPYVSYSWTDLVHPRLWESPEEARSLAALLDGFEQLEGVTSLSRDWVRVDYVESLPEGGIVTLDGRLCWSLFLKLMPEIGDWRVRAVGRPSLTLEELPD